MVFRLAATDGAFPRRKFAFRAKCVETAFSAASPSGEKPSRATKSDIVDRTTGKRFFKIPPSSKTPPPASVPRRDPDPTLARVALSLNPGRVSIPLWAVEDDPEEAGGPGVDRDALGGVGEGAFATSAEPTPPVTISLVPSELSSIAARSTELSASSAAPTLLAPISGFG